MKLLGIHLIEKKSDYHPNQRDEIRRKYLIRGPCQPSDHTFPTKKIGGSTIRFNPAWFDHRQYSKWLEYSRKTNEAFCLCCYFIKDVTSKSGGGDAFVTEGFSCWNKPERLKTHECNFTSSHSIALKKCEDLMRQNQSIATALHKQYDAIRNEHRIRLNASIDTSRCLLNCALPFRGHDESEMSLFRGNF